MKKNDELTIKIEDIGVNGEGIGHADGLALFVKDAIVGDIVRARVMKLQKTYGYAKLLEVVQPSDARTEAVCPIARSCGGCQIQEMNYEAQLAFKTKKVRENLIRIGKIDFEGEDAPVFHDCLGMENPFRYRNKAQFPVRRKNGKIQAGFYAGRTHDIIPCEDCAIGIEENQKILASILMHMENYHIEPYDEEKHSGLVRHVLIRKGFKTGEIMVCIVINGRKFPASEALTESLCRIPGMTDISLNINMAKTNRILGEELLQLYGNGYITDYIGTVRFRISPLSFYQVNPVQTEVLYGTALQYAGLTGKEQVFDLYCGVGTISLFLAQKASHVTGVEIVPQAIEDAKENARLNNMENTDFYAGAAEEVVPALYQQGRRADVVVVDPPRKGCDETLLETIVAMAPEKLVYVSCDSATLARDLKYLAAKGFRIREIQPVDMFPQCAAVECVTRLERHSDSISDLRELLPLAASRSQG